MCLDQCCKHRENRQRAKRERQRQLLQDRARRQLNRAQVLGSQQRQPFVRVHCTPAEEEDHELEEMQPVRICAEVNEPLIAKEDATPVFMPLGARGPPVHDSEPLIKQKIVKGVASPNRPATACTFGKLLKETQECRGLVSSAKNLGNIDTNVPMTAGVGPSRRTFVVRKVVYGLNRYLSEVFLLVSSLFHPLQMSFQGRSSSMGFFQ